MKKNVRKLKIMRGILYSVCIACIILALGTVGAIEQETVSLTVGTIRLVAFLSLPVVTAFAATR